MCEINTIYLIRHGETEWNHARRYQGHSDIPLHQNGEQQAIKIAEKLRTEKVDVIYASDLRRAIETARPLADILGYPISVNEKLRECHFGKFEGLTYEEILSRYPNEWNTYLSIQTMQCFPGGESLLDVETRAIHAITDICQQHSNHHVAIFTHGGTIRAILRNIFNWPSELFWSTKIEHGSITELAFRSEQWRLLSLNDTSHL